MVNIPRNLAIWQQRWQSLDKTLGEMTANDGVGSLPALCECLHTFAERYFNFFYRGFTSDSNFCLEPSRRYPEEYALRMVLAQISHDISLLQRIQPQRAASERERQVLEKADTLAYQALLPAIKQGLLPNTTVITYFQKSINIRLIPYAPVALIGIPYTAIDNLRDLLAIPHEVGHHVYRQGAIQRGAYKGSRFALLLTNRYPAQPAWLTAWLEEIFADVYGCLVAGPASALSMQDLLIDNAPTHFLADDGDHPVAALRPHIYTRVLNRLRYFDNATEMLETRWSAWLANNGNPREFIPNGMIEAISLRETVKTIEDDIINKLLSEHLSKLGPQNGNVDGMWSSDLNQGDAMETLYTQFEAWAEKQNAPAPSLEKFTNAANESWVRVPPRAADDDIQANERKLGATDLWNEVIFDAAEKAFETGQPLKMQPGVWKLLLRTYGWTTEGPDSNAEDK